MKYETTAKRLKQALNNKNMIPQELAERSQVSKASISQYINGSHAPSNISSGKMAPVLDVNPLWLMGFDVPMNQDRALIESRTTDITQEYSQQQKRILAYFNALNELGQSEAEKRLKELTQIQQYSLFIPQAAHNDYEADPDEQEKMRIDLTELKRPKDDTE